MPKKCGGWMIKGMGAVESRRDSGWGRGGQQAKGMGEKI